MSQSASKPSRWRRWAVVLGVLLVPVIGVVFLGWYKLFREVPQEYVSDEWNFKYGSIGSENEEGTPYWIWLVLPRLFPEYLPAPGGYAALGVVYEPGEELPIGFSKKTIGFPRVAINCAVCHTATVRTHEGENPTIYQAAPANRFDTQSYLRFLFACASDPRFTADNLLAEMEYNVKLSWLDEQIYRSIIIPQTRKMLLKQKDGFAWTHDDVHAKSLWGRGRIDPFNPAKFRMLHIAPDATIGNSDMMPIWNLQARQGQSLHWDGLQGSVHESVVSSALGDGATPKTLPLARLERLEKWLTTLPPPDYPFAIKKDRVPKGKKVYDAHCASCHAPGGERTGKVIPLDEPELRTDRHRLDMWTAESRDRYNRYGDGTGGTFRDFRKTDGYVAVPLGGLWLRAPYLHNGSVPSLEDLLEEPSKRPPVFHRGYDVYDPVKVGFVTSGPAAERDGFRFDVRVPGNGNGGHTYGTGLSRQEKQDLIEFLKTQ